MSHVCAAIINSSRLATHKVCNGFQQIICRLTEIHYRNRCTTSYGAYLHVPNNTLTDHDLLSTCYMHLLQLINKGITSLHKMYNFSVMTRLRFLILSNTKLLLFFPAAIHAPMFYHQNPPWMTVCFMQSPSTYKRFSIFTMYKVCRRV